MGYINISFVYITCHVFLEALHLEFLHIILIYKSISSFAS